MDHMITIGYIAFSNGIQNADTQFINGIQYARSLLGSQNQTSAA
jgi:hypothetical protein